MDVIKLIQKVFIISFLLVSLQVNSQVINPREVLKREGTNRANSKIEEGIGAGFNKVEEGVGNIFRKKKEQDKQKETEETDNETSSGEEAEEEGKPVSGPQGPKLQSTTQYDFVPGDKILYFDDFSQDALGDFPALWTSNGSGEVKTVNIAPGKWFHLNGEDAVYCYNKSIAFPDNFIIEFDIIPDEEYGYGITLTLYREDTDDPKELNDDLYPGKEGVHINLKKDGWETKGYRNDGNSDWITGQASRNPVVMEQVNHVIIWIQKRRVRIYHQGAKALDVPTNMYENTRFDRMRFSGWDAQSYPMVTNLKITTAAPDTRSKLITEGKLVTYGINFDVNKAVIKPESTGTLKEIAKVLSENPDVRIKIIGHTDSDGDDALNLDLSKRRADAVKEELTKSYAIDASRMETDGAGEKQPLAPNDTPVNKALNRRVEFVKL